MLLPPLQVQQVNFPHIATRWSLTKRNHRVCCIPQTFVPRRFRCGAPKADALPTWDNPSAGTSSTTIKFNDYFAYLASAEELANSLDEADEQDKLAALTEAIQNAKTAYDGLASLPNLQQKNVDDIVAALKAAITAAMA